MPDPKTTTTAATSKMARWKKALIALSLLMMAAGVAVPRLTGGRDGSDGAMPLASRPRTGAATIDSDPAIGPLGLAPDSSTDWRLPIPDVNPDASPVPTPSPQPGGDGAETDCDIWSPMLFRLGFSFFVGFSLAYGLRTFFRFTIVGVGMVLFVLFGLQYAGLVEIHWSAFEGRYDSIVNWLQQQTAGFRTFITGQLPSAGSAMAGLFIGFTRR